VSLERNKEVVREFLVRMPSGAPEFFELMTDDVTWWVPPSVPLGGLYEGKEGVRGFLTDGVDIYDPAVPIVATVEHIIAEGERVAAQTSVTARTLKGLAYDNRYHWAFRLRDGLVCEVREYVDTKYAWDTLFAPPEASE
jgi:ketosteroid isomerase-like protein